MSTLPILTLGQVDANLTCPVSCDYMSSPVLAPCCGNSFEQQEIITALAVKSICPLCRGTLTKDKLIPNLALKNISAVLGPEKVTSERIFMIILMGRGEKINTEHYQQAIKDTKTNALYDFFREQLDKKIDKRTIRERLIDNYEDELHPSVFRKINGAFHDAYESHMNQEKKQLTIQIASLQEEKTIHKKSSETEIAKAASAHKKEVTLLQQQVKKIQIEKNNEQVFTAAGGGTLIVTAVAGIAGAPVTIPLALVGAASGVFGLIIAQESKTTTTTKK